MQDERQITSDIFMIRPRSFGPSADTAQSNFFQHSVALSPSEIQTRALAEFDGLVDALSGAGINLLVFEDSEWTSKPDAVFPNNWISSHADGRVFLYPMEAISRRAERRPEIVESMAKEFGVAEIVDLSASEEQGVFLEGTGSMVLDRVNRTAYAALSSRTHESALVDFSGRAGYEVVAFETSDASGRPIYHTNILLGIGEKFVVVCADAIADQNSREEVLGRLHASGRNVVEITLAQMASFAGNLIELAAGPGESIIAMSAAAHRIMSNAQLDALAHCGRIMPVPVNTIECVGGGSVRCMIAEIFLPRITP